MENRRSNDRPPRGARTTTAPLGFRANCRLVSPGDVLALSRMGHRAWTKSRSPTAVRFGYIFGYTRNAASRRVSIQRHLRIRSSARGEPPDLNPRVTAWRDSVRAGHALISRVLDFGLSAFICANGHLGTRVAARGGNQSGDCGGVARAGVTRDPPARTERGAPSLLQPALRHRRGHGGRGAGLSGLARDSDDRVHRRGRASRLSVRGAGEGPQVARVRADALTSGGQRLVAVALTGGSRAERCRGEPVGEPRTARPPRLGHRIRRVAVSRSADSGGGRNTTSRRVVGRRVGSA
jgi:hypothetical protein